MIVVGFNGDFWNPQSVAIPVVFLNPILVQNSCQQAPIKLFGKIAIFGQIHLIQLGVAGYWVDQFGRGLRQNIQLYIYFINSQKKSFPKTRICSRGEGGRILSDIES